MNMTLNEIEEAIRSLSLDSQRLLSERIAKNLTQTGLAREQCLDWDTLYGLGQNLWADDAKEYVRKLRENRSNGLI